MVPIEVKVSSARLSLTSNVSDFHYRIYNVEALDEKRQNAKEKWLSYQRQIDRAYNKRVRPRHLKFGNLVLKAAPKVERATYHS